MHEPSNSEIMEKLGSIEARFDVRLHDILEQVKRTNGRVTKLEAEVTLFQKWKDKLDTIAEYKKDNGDGTKTVDWQKILMYTLGIISTLVAALIFLAKR